MQTGIFQQLVNKIFLVGQKQYEVQSFVGEGSHATVWCARSRFYPYDELIIKIAKEKDGIVKERVQNEIWFLKDISHSNIPPLLDQGMMDGYLWLSMPVYQTLSIQIPVEGALKKIDISDIRPQGYPQSAQEIPIKYREQAAAGVLRDIGNVIVYLSGTGIVHADISPGNIMEKRGSLLNKQYVLIDWGASALIHRYPEHTFGSLHFTAPERLLGNIGIKSDLFSLGVACFYILTGTVPYSGQDGKLYYMSIVERDGIAPSEILSGISSTIDKLVRDLIRYRPEDRPEPYDVVKRMEKIRI